MSFGREAFESFCAGLTRFEEGVEGRSLGRVGEEVVGLSKSVELSSRERIIRVLNIHIHMHHLQISFATKKRRVSVDRKD